METKSPVARMFHSLNYSYCRIFSGNVRKRQCYGYAVVFLRAIGVRPISLSLVKRVGEKGRPKAREESCYDAKIAIRNTVRSFVSFHPAYEAG